MQAIPRFERRGCAHSLVGVDKNRRGEGRRPDADKGRHGEAYGSLILDAS